MEGFIQLLRFAIRQLWYGRGFTLIVVTTLALSIGANTAVFSVVNALLIREFPYYRPDRIGTILTRTIGSGKSEERGTINGTQWQLLRDDVRALSAAIYSIRTAGMNLQAGPRAQYVISGRVSAGYFEVFGVNPVLGRTFSREEDLPNGAKTVIITYDLWQAVFDKSTEVLGQSVRLRGEPSTVIGVLPKGLTTPVKADAYIPLRPTREGEGTGSNYVPIVRLADNVSWKQADVELARAWNDIPHNPSEQVSYQSLPLQAAQTASLRPQTLGLMMAAALVLLIACGNLAALSIVRTLQRQSEFAVRLALGASRWRIQQQLWVESLPPALLGGVAGIGCGYLALRGLLLLLPENYLPVSSVPLDGRVLGFSLVASLFSSIAFGMLPVLAIQQLELARSVVGRGIIGRGSIRHRQALVCAEVALTTLLLAASGLLIRTLVSLQSMPPGFDPRGIVMAKASLNDARYANPTGFQKLMTQSLANISNIPGVQGAAVGLTAPYERAPLGRVFFSDGPDAGKSVMTNQTYVSPEYFKVLNASVLMGRDFTAADGPNAQPVVIVNSTFARKFLKTDNPVGRYLSDTWTAKKMLIVGVVGDIVLNSGAKLNPVTTPITREEAIYLPAAQVVDPKILGGIHGFIQPTWLVRTSASSAELQSPMQQALTGADSNLPFSGFYSVNDVVASTLATQRISVALLGTMAGLAFLLSAIGIFALVASVVAQRKREISIRMALGSTLSKVIVEIGRPGATASVLGLIVGVALCAATLPVLRGIVYGVGVYDLSNIMAVMLLFAAVTVVVTVVAVVRIFWMNPATILQGE